MENSDDLLVATCRTMIKTVLSCLDNATKGTIYKIGLMPELIAMRVLSGAEKEDSDELEWGLPAVSDYNPPGKTWEHYRDQPGRAAGSDGLVCRKADELDGGQPHARLPQRQKAALGRIGR